MNAALNPRTPSRRTSVVFPWPRNQVVLSVAVFLGFTGFTLVMPFLPLYFIQLGVHDPSANAIWSGLSFGVTPAITAAVTPAWARLADRWGRKLMVVRSLGSFAVIMTALSLATRPWHVFVLRAVQGVFAGYTPLAMMMVAESSPKHRMADALGWVQTGQRLGPALGPVVGGVLAAAIGLRETFLAAAAVYVLAVVIMILVYDESAERRRPHEAGPPATTWLDMIRVPHFLLFLATIFGLQLVDRSFGPILPLYLGAIGVTGNLAIRSGVLFTASAGAAAVGNFLTGRAMRRWTTGAIVAGAGTLAAAGVAVFGRGASMEALTLASIGLGFGMGLATTTVYAAAGHAATEEVRGMAVGYLTTAYLVGLAVSPVIAGFIGAASLRAVFVADTGTLLVIVSLVPWRIRRGAVATDGR